MKYWNRDGTEIEEAEFLRLYGDRAYRLIAEDVVGGKKVTTVWLGRDFELEMGWHDKPKPFGTMLWPDVELRWETEAEAREGHAKIVAWSEAL